MAEDRPPVWDKPQFLDHAALKIPARLVVTAMNGEEVIGVDGVEIDVADRDYSGSGEVENKAPPTLDSVTHCLRTTILAHQLRTCAELNKVLDECCPPAPTDLPGSLGTLFSETDTRRRMLFSESVHVENGNVSTFRGRLSLFYPGIHLLDEVEGVENQARGSIYFHGKESREVYPSPNLEPPSHKYLHMESPWATDLFSSGFWTPFGRTPLGLNSSGAKLSSVRNQDDKWGNDTWTDSEWDFPESTRNSLFLV